jgi:hypothetical protein
MGDSTIKSIQRRKLMRAVHLLESTNLSIELVAERVGYQKGRCCGIWLSESWGTGWDSVAHIFHALVFVYGLKTIFRLKLELLFLYPLTLNRFRPVLFLLKHR